MWGGPLVAPVTLAHCRSRASRLRSELKEETLEWCAEAHPEPAAETSSALHSKVFPGGHAKRTDTLGTAAGPNGPSHATGAATRGLYAPPPRTAPPAAAGAAPKTRSVDGFLWWHEMPCESMSRAKRPGVMSRRVALSSAFAPEVA